MASKIKLFKLASEINIGKETIVEFLQNKGFDIQNKPTTDLTEDMIDAVYNKFKKEKRAAELQREKISKQKETRKPLEKTTESVKEEKKPINDRINELLAAVKPKPVVEDKPVIVQNTITEIASKVEEPIKETAKVEKEKQDSTKKVNRGKNDIEYSQTEPGETPKLKGLNVLGKIEFDKPKPKQPKHENNFKRERKKKITGNINSALTQEQKEKLSSVQTGKPNKNWRDRDNRADGDSRGFNRGGENRGADNRGFNRGGENRSTDNRGFNRGGENRNTDNRGFNRGGENRGADNRGFNRSGENRGGDNRSFNQGGENRSYNRGGENSGGFNRGGDNRGNRDNNGNRFNNTGGDFRKRGENKSPNSIDNVYKIKPSTEQAPSIVDNSANFKKRKKNSSYVNIDEEVNKRKDATVSIDKNKKKKKKSVRETIKDEDINKAIKATLAGMEDTGASARQKAKQKKKIEREIKSQIEQEELERTSKILQLTEFVTTSDLANFMNVSPSEIIKKCMLLGLMVSINQRLDKDTITLIADDYGFDVDFQDQKVFTAIEDEDDPEETLKPRAPIVTIMGHVDHGKTSLLDHIRNTRVVAGESGGITQHIGAYRVIQKNNKFITFLDTPGHEAFTAMRARGAQITDIVILVVAADDSVMPQTKEAISHAQAANVPIVVAINKIDKPAANPEKIKQQLSENNVLVEEWGGKYQAVEISAKQGINIDELLDKIILEADLLDLKANPYRNARATVIESNLDKGMGVVTTIIVRKGTLKIGDVFVAGTSFGKVRAMFDERGNKLEEAIPSTPVRIVGFDGMPSSGDNFVVVDSESQAKKIANERLQLKREQELKQVRRVTLNEFSNSIAGGEIQTLNVILKADVNGSVEALSDELQKLNHKEVAVNMLLKGVGQITESDIQLALASNAIIMTFRTGVTTKAKQLADKEGVEIRNYEVIYEAIDDVKNALEGMLKPEVSEQISGEAEIRNIFKLGRTHKIAGCKVISGKILRNSKARILRDGLPIHEGKISSLKREKDDAKEVAEGYECGIMIENFNEYMEDDIIQTFTFIETKRTF